jgi:hypothetical protein
MAMTGSLKTLFETRTSSSNIKSRASTTTTTTTVDFVPPSYFKVDGKFRLFIPGFKILLFIDEQQEVEFEEEEGFDDDDDILSISSDDDETIQTS